MYIVFVIRNRPFNLQGGGLWFFVSFKLNGRSLRKFIYCNIIFIYLSPHLCSIYSGLTLLFFYEYAINTKKSLKMPAKG